VKNKLSLLPHEWIFGGYLVSMWARLFADAGPAARDTLFYLALIVVNAVLIARCQRSETNLNWRIRLLFYPIAMNVCYMLSRTAVPAIHPFLEDARLQAIDHALIGTNLSVRAQAIAHPALTEFFSVCYILFFPNLFVGMVYYFVGNLEVLKKFFVGLFTLYGIGLFGYSVVPALGPWLAMTDDFTVPLRGWIVTDWNAEMVRVGSNRVDVFPSLHCAVSSFILAFDFQHKRWRFWMYLVPCVGLWVSTIYLRYHYLIDVICGFALSALSLWIVHLCSKQQRP
jgi:membrane-associated phospholipid phosphatase